MLAQREAVAPVPEGLEQALAIHAGPAAEQQRLGKRGDGLGDHHVQQQLGYRTGPAFAAMLDCPGHAIQQRRQPGECPLVGPDHEADTAVGNRLDGPGDRGIDIARALFGEGGGELAGESQRHRAAIDNDIAGARVGQQPVLAQTDEANLRRPRQRQEDDIAIARHPPRVRGRNAPLQGAGSARLGVGIVDDSRQAGAPDEVPAHGPAHGAEPDESQGRNVRYVCLAPA